MAKSMEDLAHATPKPYTPSLPTSSATPKEEGEIYRPLTIVKCHIDLLKLTEQEMAAGSHSISKTGTNEQGMNEFSAEKEKQLAELAAEISHNAIENAILETVEWQDVGSLESVNRSCCHMKAHVCYEDAVVLETVKTTKVNIMSGKIPDPLIPKSDVPASSTTENKMNAQHKIEPGSGDMLQLARDNSQTTVTSGETGAMKCSELVEADGESRNTTLSQLSSDLFHCREIPAITLTACDGQIEEVLPSQTAASQIKRSNCITADNCSPHTSIEQTGLSQLSLTRDDTLNSSSVSERRIVNSSDDQFVENRSEHTEISAKELCLKDDFSEKSSLSSKVLQMKMSDVNVSQAENNCETNELHVATQTLQVSQTIHRATQCSTSRAGNQHTDSNNDTLNAASVSSVSCCENTITKQIAAVSANTSLQETPLEQKAENNSNMVEGVVSSQPICETINDVEEEFLLAEAEAAFFAELDDASTNSAVTSPQTVSSADINESVDTAKPKKKSKPITSDWVTAKPFQPRKAPMPPVYNQNTSYIKPSGYNQSTCYNRQSHYEGSSQYFNNNNCHDRSQSRQHIVSADGEYSGNDFHDGPEMLEHVGEDNCYEEVQDIIVLPDQQTKPQQQAPPLNNNARSGPRFRMPPPRFCPPYHQPPHQPPHMHRPPYQPHNYPYQYPPARCPGFARPPYPQQSRPMYNTAHPLRAAMANPAALQHNAPPFSAPPMAPPPHCIPSQNPQSSPSLPNGQPFCMNSAEEFDKVCNIRDSLVPYKEIDGCCYFDPNFIPDKPPPGMEYGYPQRGKRRKAVRLSSRFPTQAGKFHHHANFYVRNCAETAMSNPHDAN